MLPRYSLEVVVGLFSLFCAIIKVVVSVKVPLFLWETLIQWCVHLKQTEENPPGSWYRSGLNTSRLIKMCYQGTANESWKIYNNSKQAFGCRCKYVIVFEARHILHPHNDTDITHCHHKHLNIIPWEYLPVVLNYVEKSFNWNVDLWQVF